MDTVLRTQDEWIALRCQLGEPEAFEALVRLLERPLLYYAAKLLGDEARAPDALQEVWIRAFRGIRRLKEPASLRPWLYAITRAVAIDSIRRHSSRERAEESAGEAFAESAEPDFDDADAAAIHQALDRLDLKYREVLVLHFLEDFSLAEIAQVLVCPEGTVKSRVHYAKKAMKDILLRGGYGSQK